MQTSSVPPESSAVDNSRWAWIFPVLALVAASALTTGLPRLGMSAAAVDSAQVWVGLAGGSAWQVFHRRDFVERFNVWAVLFAVAALLGFLPGAEVDTSGPWAPPWAALGMLAGIVLAESWRRRRSRGAASVKHDQRRPVTGLEGPKEP